MTTDSDLVSEIKTRLGITGTYQNDLILAYANDVKDFMRSGGISDDIINGSESVGCIARGVADLWNLGAGDGKFSTVFLQRLVQLRLEVEDDV